MTEIKYFINHGIDGWPISDVNGPISDNQGNHRRAICKLLNQLNDERDSLQSQLSEAQAQCERLREAAGKIRHWHDAANDGMIVSAESVRELWTVRNETPAQSLVEIQIQAIQKFVGSTFPQPFVDYDGETIYKRSEEYISRLRQQG